ncbi:autotransporter-associated beta strand repeat-containing protein [Coraliomargarita sp. W4R72]
MIALPTKLFSSASAPVFASFVFLAALSSQAQSVWEGAVNSDLQNLNNWAPSTAWGGGSVLRFDGTQSGDLDLTYSTGQGQRVLYEFTAAQTDDVGIRLTDATSRTFAMGFDDGDTAISIAAGAGHVFFDGDADLEKQMIVTFGSGATGHRDFYIQNEGTLEFGAYTTFKQGSSSGNHRIHLTGGGVTTIRGVISTLGSGGGLIVEDDSTLILDDSRYSSNQLLTIAQGLVEFTTSESVAGANVGYQPIVIGNNVAAGQGTLRYTGTTDTTVSRRIQIGNGVGSDSQTGSATVENSSTTGKLVFNNATFNAVQTGFAARTLTLGGSNAMDNEITGVIADNDTGNGATVAVIKADAGKWILSGTNTYTGATLVEAGTLAIDAAGSISDSAGVMVDAGATFDVSALTGGFILESGQWIGGDGTVSGDLNLDSGAFLIFDAVVTLMVTGDVTLDDTFGVASLLSSDGSAVDWSSVAGGVYTLIDNDSDFSNITNFGAEDAYDLGDGRSAYFQNGSLQLVVVPEPSSYALLGGLLALGCVMSRRKCD